MTAREYLKQVFILDKLIKAKQSRVHDLRDKLQWISGTAPGTRVQSSPTPDRMGDLTAKLLDLTDECLSDIGRLTDMQQEIEAIIRNVEREDYKLILFERYVNLKRWEDIAQDNHYSVRRVHELHSSGLAMIVLNYCSAN